MNAIADGIVEKWRSHFSLERYSSVNTNKVIFGKFIDNNPNCFIFGYEKDGRTFVGASPEILVRHRGSEILSYALAGQHLNMDQMRTKNNYNNG